MDLGKIMAWENGEMNDEDTAIFFQELINSGLCWKLQGCYGRMAKDLIEAGICYEKENVSRVS